MKVRVAAMFACAAPFAALAGIVPGKDGPLVRSEDSKPVFLVSTTGKWSSSLYREVRIEY